MVILVSLYTAIYEIPHIYHSLFSTQEGLLFLCDKLIVVNLHDCAQFPKYSFRGAVLYLKRMESDDFSKGRMQLCGT
jgi:hypothetical protein